MLHAPGHSIKRQQRLRSEDIDKSQYHNHHTGCVLDNIVVWWCGDCSKLQYGMAPSVLGLDLVAMETVESALVDLGLVALVDLGLVLQRSKPRRR